MTSTSMIETHLKNGHADKAGLSKALFDISQEIAFAENEQAVVNAVAKHKPVGVDTISLIIYDNYDVDNATGMILAADWGSMQGVMTGMRIAIADFPFSKLVERTQLMVIEDVLQDPRIDPITAQNLTMFNTYAFASMPLRVGERIIGALTFACFAPYKFQDDELFILKSLEKQIALTLDHFRLERESEKRAVELQTVAAVSSALSTILDLDELLPAIVQRTCDSFGLYHAHIYLLDESGKYLLLAAGAGEAGRAMKARGHKIAINHPHSIVARAARTRKAVVVNDVASSPDFLPNPLLPQTKSELALPMIVNDQVIGVLDVQSEQLNRFDEGDVRVKAILASQAAAAVENARAFTYNRRQLQLQKANVAISELVRSELDTETMLEGAINVLIELFGGDNGVMSRFNHDAQRWEGFVGAGTGMTSAQAKQFIDPAKAYPHGYEAIQKGRVVAVDSAKDYPDFPKEYIEIIGIKSVITLPIQGQGRIDGVIFINFNTSQHTFSREEIELAEVIASQLSVGIQRRTAEEERVRLAVEVQRSAELFRTVIDATPDWIFAKDRDFRFILGNKSFLDNMGRSSSDLLGKDDSEIGFEDELIFGNPDKGIRGFRVDDIAALSGQIIDNDNDVVVMADGETHVLHTRKMPLRDQNGEIFGMMGIARDITEQRRAEEQVRLYAKVVDNMGTGVYVYHLEDADDAASLRLVAANNAAGKFTGVQNDQIVGKRILEAFPMLGETEVPQIYRDVALNGNAVYLGEIPYQDENLKPGVYEVRAFPLPNRMMGVSFENITERKNAEAQVERRARQLQTVADVSRATTTILEQDKLLNAVVDLTKSNFNLYHAHIYLLDSREKNLILAAGAGEPGRLMVEQGHHIPLSHPNSIVAVAARTAQPVTANDVQRTPDFLPNPLLPNTRSELAVPMIVGDRVIGVLDVQAEELNRFNEDDALIQSTLAGQVAVALENARSVQLALAQERAAAEQLREVDRLKSQFLANMSHELRTPLNSIIGYSEVLMDGDDGELTAEALEDVTIIHNSGRHLLAIINDILDLAKIEAGRMRMERKLVDLTALVFEAVQTSQVLVKDKPVTLSVESAENIPLVYGDDIRIRQVLDNLIGNAAKFTTKGSITVILSMESPSSAAISVRDTGVGIARKDLDTIFEQFKQVDNSATRRAGGTGLGLTITRRLVEMMGGEIRVESEIGVGTTFTFTLPVRVNEAMPA